MRTCRIRCSNEIHRIGVDDKGIFHLLDHDADEEAALEAMGLETARCYNLLNNNQIPPSSQLQHAAINGNLDKIKLAILAGAEHVALSRALLVAAGYGYAEIVRELISAGADIHYKSDMPLAWAAMDGRTAVVSLILSVAGQQINVQDKRFALKQAKQRNQHHVVAILSENISQHKRSGQ